MRTRSLPEQVNALEETVATLESLPKDVAELRVEFREFRAEVNGRFDGVNGRFEGVNGRFERLEQHVRDEIDRLYSRMLSLHEDLISRIKILGEGSAGSSSSPARPPRRKPKR